MQKITKIYRKDYVGQNVVVDMTYEGDTWKYQHEWVPNDVHNNHTTTQAIVSVSYTHLTLPTKRIV